jgi:GNAT superfamily N-acetyltransferase
MSADAAPHVIPPPDIRRVTAALVRPLRQQVLRPHLPFEYNVYPGDDDRDTYHAAAYHADRVVGSATAIHQPLPHEANPLAWRLRGVTTLPEVRGYGYGRALVLTSLAYVRSQGANYLWFYANIPAIGFYERLGFQQHPTLNDGHISDPPHPLMWCTISN